MSLRAAPNRSPGLPDPVSSGSDKFATVLRMCPPPARSLLDSPGCGRDVTASASHEASDGNPLTPD